MGFLLSLTWLASANNLAPLGSGILGFTAAVDGNPGTLWFHAGLATYINDGNPNTHVDDYSAGDDKGQGVSFVGILWPTVRYEPIQNLTLTLAAFEDGGWFGPNIAAPGAGGTLTPAYLTEPSVQISTNGGTNWTTVPATSDYMNVFGGATIGGGPNPNPKPLTTIFTLNPPVTNINGIRIIGQNGGTADGDGFLGVFELAVSTDSITPDDDWSAKWIALTNTSQAAFTARVGDIDNLGFGWPTGFDPFSGISTPVHTYPWTADPADPDGTDRIMVVSSYLGTPPCLIDGYTRDSTRPENAVRPIVLSYALPPLTVTDAVLQIFVDDFQAPVWCANYTVTLNGRRASFLETVINQLVQTGPIGKLITISIPADFLNEVATGRLSFTFDDTTTGAGDGYAIDFIKLLVNGRCLQTGSISGHVRDAETSQPVAGAQVTSFGRTTNTDATGFYLLAGVPAGLAFVQAAGMGYAPTNCTTDVIADQTLSNVDFVLPPAPLTLSIAHAVLLRFFAWSGKNYALQYSGDFVRWFDDEGITGIGAEEIRYRLTDTVHQFWRVKQN